MLKSNQHRIIKKLFFVVLIILFFNELSTNRYLVQKNYYSQINYNTEERIFMPVKTLGENGSLFSREISNRAKTWRSNYEFTNPDIQSISIKNCQVYQGVSSVLIKPKLKGTFLVFIVNTSPRNFQRRTWLREMFQKLREHITLHLDQKPSFEVIYSVGSTSNATLNDELLTESALYRDLLMSSINDTYETLTLKTFFSIQVNLTGLKAGFGIH